MIIFMIMKNLLKVLNNKLNKKKEILAIIPARSGSKGIKNKNIKLLNGHPLLSYAIAAGLNSKLVSRVICSTDAKKIAVIAKKYGAEVPFLRPKNIAKDLSTDFEVFFHALKFLKKKFNYNPDYVVNLRPTSPIRKKNTLDVAIDKFINSNKYDSIRSVCLNEKTPYKMWFIKNNNLSPIINSKKIKEAFNLPRQLLPNTYWQTAEIDITKTSTILKKKSMTGKKILPFVLNNKISIDIDSHKDFKHAAKILKTNKKFIKPNLNNI